MRAVRVERGAHACIMQPELSGIGGGGEGSRARGSGPGGGQMADVRWQAKLYLPLPAPKSNFKTLRH